MDLFAVTGRPIIQSRSPELFRAAFGQRQNGTQGFYLRLIADTAREAMQLFEAAGIRAMNVTSPYKRDIVGLVSVVDDDARTIGAVNTVVRRDSGTVGWNTDHIGLSNALLARDSDWKGKKGIVLGAGGAGRAAAFGLRQLGVEVVIVNRTEEHAKLAATALSCEAASLAHLEGLLRTTDLVVSTMPPHVHLIQKDWLRPTMTVCDANYHQHDLIRAAAAMGCTVISGQEWLVGQAVPAFSLFTGDAPDSAAMRQSFERPSLTLDQSRPIALIGFMGSGKTSVASRLAERLTLPFFDTDNLVASNEKASIAELFRYRGEAWFREREATMLRSVLSRGPAIIACGGGVTVAEENRQLLQARARTIWCFSDLHTCLARVATNPRPLLDATHSRNEIDLLFRERLQQYASVADMIIDTSGPLDSIVRKLHAEISYSI